MGPLGSFIHWAGDATWKMGCDGSACARAVAACMASVARTMAWSAVSPMANQGEKAAAMMRRQVSRIFNCLRFRPERKRHCGQHAHKRRNMVPRGRGFKIEKRKPHKNHERDHLLDDL